MPVVKYSLVGDSKDLEQALARAGTSLKELGLEADTASKKVDKVEASGKAASKSTKSFSGDLKTLGKSMASEATGGMALTAAFVAFAGAAVVAVKSLTVLAQGLSDATKESELLAPQLALIAGMEIISPESIAAANDYQGKLGLIDTAASGLAQVIVDELAPQMSESATIAAGATIEFLKFESAIVAVSSAFLDAHPVFSEATKDIAGTLLVGNTAAGFLELANSIGEASGAWAHFAEIGGKAQAALDEAAAKDKAWADEKARIAKEDDARMERTKKSREDAVKAAKKASDEGVKASNAVTISFEEEDEAVAGLAEIINGDLLLSMDAVKSTNSATSESMYQLQSSIAAVNSTLDKTGEKVREKVDWEEFGKNASDAFDQVTQGIDYVVGAVQNLFDLQDARADEEIAKAKKAKKAKKKELDAALKDFEENGKAMTGSERIEADKRVDDARQAMQDQDKIIEAQEAKKKQRALISFRIGQGMDISQAIMQGALSAMAMIPGIATAMGPLAAGAPAVAAGIAAVATGLNVATIAAQKPPSMHSGGVVDEVNRTLLQGEGVANRTAMGDPEFRNSMEAANRGMGGRGRESNSQDIYLNDRFFQRVSKRNARVSSSKKRQGIANHYSGRRAT